MDKAAAEGGGPNPLPDLPAGLHCGGRTAPTANAPAWTLGNGKVLRVKLPQLAIQDHKPQLMYLGAQGFGRQACKATASPRTGIANSETRFHGPAPSYFPMGNYVYVVLPAENAPLDRVSVAYIPLKTQLSRYLLPKHPRTQCLELFIPPKQSVSPKSGGLYAKAGPENGRANDCVQQAQSGQKQQRKP